MALPKVYIETSVVSYLTAFPSRDIVVAAHQQITHSWWAVSGGFDRYVSEAVLTEAAAGDPEAATRRMAAISAYQSLRRRASRRNRSRSWHGLLAHLELHAHRQRPHPW
jgi:hypothetical protein